MSFKDILLLVDEDSTAAGTAAVALAGAFKAQLTVAGLVPDTVAALAFSETSSALLSDAIEAARAAAESAIQAGAAQAKEAGLIADTEFVPVGAGTDETGLPRLLRRFDLSVIEQPNPDFPSERRMMIDSALFASGRPVLVVPYVQTTFQAQAETILVAWDGSAHAARAIGDALPILRGAKRVEIVTVGNPKLETSGSGAAMQRHLARHGVPAKYHPLAGDVGVAGALLSYCSDAQADVLVMGGYGHSRFSEFVLGGTTREILKSMTLPVFMSH